MSKGCLLWIAVLLASLMTAAGCGGDTKSGAGATTNEGAAASSTDTATPELLGSWHRAQTCKEMRAAFEEAGLAESQRLWLQGNFYGGERGPKKGDPCVGAEGPLEHDHVFRTDGVFGSHDQNGEDVDSGDFELVDGNTVSFPSHAEEFGYDGDLVVDYTVSGDSVTFVVALPDPCVDACAEAYAWALSAFASGSWQRGEVPL
jgi:hypothetical protein